jgi:hypothetical protein
LRPLPVDTSFRMENGPTTPQQTLWVGKDHLTIGDEHVIIDAAHEIPDWQVREFQRMPIFLGEFKFFLRQRIPAQTPFTVRYILERWPEDAHFSAAAISFTYDEQFVLERDAEFGRTQRFEKLGKTLIALYPLLGFLWADTKKKLIPAGFIPRSITGVSIFSCFCVMMMQGVFLRNQVGFFTASFGSIHGINFPLLVADYAFFGLLLLDIILRFDQHIRHTTDYPWGFCEWITAPFRRKPVDDEEIA